MCLFLFLFLFLFLRPLECDTPQCEIGGPASEDQCGRGRWCAQVKIGFCVHFLTAQIFSNICMTSSLLTVHFLILFVIFLVLILTVLCLIMIQIAAERTARVRNGRTGQVGDPPRRAGPAPQQEHAHFDLLQHCAVLSRGGVCDQPGRCGGWQFQRGRGRRE